MADSNFEGTNLLGGPFKPYVDEQVAQRQTRLGSIQKSQEDIVWENGKSAYLALASSVNIENTTYREIGNEVKEVSVAPSFQNTSNSVIFDDTQTTLRNVKTEITKTHNDGEKRIKQLGLPDEYYGNQLANNLVLFGGTAYFETSDADENDTITSNEYSNPYYRSGLATSDSLLNNSAYGFGGTSFGLSAMPGLTSFNIKSRNMGSLREASITIRANNKEQFSLIDSLYCRIGYTMFMEWGNSIYFNNDGKYISNPNAAGVTSLLPVFLSGKNGNKSISDNPNQFLQLIEKRREKSNGNYDAFFGKVKNFSWVFNPAGYYEITLSLISQGDIIESLNIDGQYGGTSTVSNITGPLQPSPNETSALTSFLTTAASPSKAERTLVIPASFSPDGSTPEQIINISKFQNYKTFLLPDVTTSKTTSANLGVSATTTNTTGSIALDTIESLNYDRLKSSIGKIVSGTAVFSSEKPYFYIRLGDILDFIKDRLLIYTSEGNNEPILDIDTDTDKNVCYYSGINVSADPSKVMVRAGLPYTKELLKGLKYNPIIKKDGTQDEDWGWEVRTPNIFNFKEAKLERFLSTVNPNDSTESFALHGKIMNIYFEYEYLLNAIKGLRNEKTGTISLYDFVDELCQTANSCLGGVNKLSIRLEDDRIMRIYDQNPIYGTQNVKSSVINLYGINPTGSIGNQGSFVTDFNVKTELTNDFATQVTIGAQAQSNNVGSDATGLSSWNSGLKDRFFPEKIDSLRKNNGTTTPTTQDRINKLTQQLKYLWLGYSEANVTSITNTTFTSAANSDTSDNVLWFEHFDTKRYSSFVKLQKDWLQEIIKLENENFNKIQVKADKSTLGTNQIGMIPINISVTLEGISGIRIYDKLEVDTRFLPEYYPQTLIWVIKGVSHEIQNNKWYTNLETIAVPKLPGSQNFDNILGNKREDGDLKDSLDTSNLTGFTGPTPNADILRSIIATLDGVVERKKEGYKYGELSTGGDITENMAKTAGSVLSTLKQKLPKVRLEITAGNDKYHQDFKQKRAAKNIYYNSNHLTGGGVDFIVTGGATSKQVSNVLYAMFLGTPKLGFLNEYGYKTVATSGKHFHIAYADSASSRDGRITTLEEAKDTQKRLEKYGGLTPITLNI